MRVLDYNNDTNVLSDYENELIFDFGVSKHTLCVIAGRSRVADNIETRLRRTRAQRVQTGKSWFSYTTTHAPSSSQNLTNNDNGLATIYISFHDIAGEL